MTLTPDHQNLLVEAQVCFDAIVHEFVQDLRREGVSESYVIQHRGPARHFLTWLERMGIALKMVDGTVIHCFLQHDCDCGSWVPKSTQRHRPGAVRSGDQRSTATSPGTSQRVPSRMKSGKLAMLQRHCDRRIVPPPRHPPIRPKPSLITTPTRVNPPHPFKILARASTLHERRHHRPSLHDTNP